MNIDKASEKFTLMLRFKERIAILEQELKDMDKEGYNPPKGSINIGKAYSRLGNLELEVNRDQLRGQITRELAALKADLKAQAYELGEYFGI